MCLSNVCHADVQAGASPQSEQWLSHDGENVTCYLQTHVVQTWEVWSGEEQPCKQDKSDRPVISNYFVSSEGHKLFSILDT